MGLIGDLARRAGIGGTTLSTIDALEQHPEALAAGAAGLGALGINALFPGMALNKPGLGIANAFQGHVSNPSLPVGLGSQPGPNLQALMQAMEATGRTVEGLQPWHVSGFKIVASGTAIGASSDIVDMFGSAQTRLFTADDTFPWTFLCKRFRCAIVAEPVTPGTEDGAWQRQLCLLFKVATEVGRVSLDALGCERIIEGPAAAGSGGGGVASQQFPNPGVPFPVIFEKNGTYIMNLHTDFPITTTFAFTFVYQMDGWVVQNTSAISEAAIVSALGSLLGQGAPNIATEVLTRR